MQRVADTLVPMIWLISQPFRPKVCSIDLVLGFVSSFVFPYLVLSSALRTFHRLAFLQATASHIPPAHPLPPRVNNVPHLYEHQSSSTASNPSPTTHRRPPLVVANSLQAQVLFASAPCFRRFPPGELSPIKESSTSWSRMVHRRSLRWFAPTTRHRQAF